MVQRSTQLVRVLLASGLVSLAALLLSVGCSSPSSSTENENAGANNAGANNAGGNSGGASGGGGAAAGAAGMSLAGSGGGDQTAVATACAAYATARCTHYRDCVPFAFSLLYTSLADCQALTSQFCPLELAAPGTSRGPAVLSACAQATVPLTCGEWLSTVPAASCKEPGKLPTGSGCEYDSQCASTFCRVDSGWCGKCEERHMLGAQCKLGAGDCVAGLKCAHFCPTSASCANTPESWHCAVPKLEQEACTVYTDCRDDLYCIDNVCSKGKALGATCALDQLECPGDLRCVASGSGATCVQATFAALGGTCDSSIVHYCDSTTTCANSAGQPSDLGTCVARSKPGQSCTMLDCATPAHCIDGVCVLPVDANTCH